MKSDFSRFIARGLLAALPVVLVIAALGCGVHVGPTGIDVVLGGSFYTRDAKQTDNRSVEADKGEDASGPSEVTTHATRTWGTSGIVAEITDTSEKISIQGKGLSKNLSETLGKDIVKDALAAALKSTPTGAALAAGRALLGDDDPPPLNVLRLRPLDRIEPDPPE